MSGFGGEKEVSHLVGYFPAAMAMGEGRIILISAEAPITP